MKKSIKKHIIARILSNPYEASDYLVFLNSVVSDDRDIYATYSRKKIKKQVSPFLSYFNLAGKKFKVKNIDSVTKIAEDIKKVLIKRINIISQKEDMKNIYELTSLLFALDCLSCGRKTLDISVLVKNEKVLICYDLAIFIIDYSERKDAIKRFERLKKLNFN